MNDGKIELLVDGKTKECTIIFSFASQDKNYIVYTNDEIDEDGFTKTYVGEYVKIDGVEKLLPVEDEKILLQTEKLLEKIDGEDNN